VLIVAQAVKADTSTLGIDARQDYQHKHIERGVASGQLTPLEARRLKIQQDRIETAEHAAKADGIVTEEERIRISLLQHKAKHVLSRKERNDRKLNEVLDELQFRRY
jgi:uncharacterized membrane protein YebE (DUF533 family)